MFDISVSAVGMIASSWLFLGLPAFVFIGLRLGISGNRIGGIGLVSVFFSLFAWPVLLLFLIYAAGAFYGRNKASSA